MDSHKFENNGDFSNEQNIIYAGIDKFDNVTQKYTRQGGYNGYVAGNRQVKYEWEDIYWLSDNQD